MSSVQISQIDPDETDDDLDLRASADKPFYKRVMNKLNNIASKDVIVDAIFGDMFQR